MENTRPRPPSSLADDSARAVAHWAATGALGHGRRALSARTCRLVAILFFIGVNVTFLPMHLTGLIGMPRRVYTYPEALDWGGLNLLSSIGAVIIAASILLFLIDLARNFRPMTEQELGDLLAQSREPGSQGKFERFKTTRNYDGGYHRKQHGVS